MLRDISYSTLAHNIGFTEIFGSDSLCAPTDLVFFKGSPHAHAHQDIGKGGGGAGQTPSIFNLSLTFKIGQESCDQTIVPSIQTKGFYGFN